MICQRRHPKPLFCWFRAAAKMVAWAIVVYIIATGLQACKASKFNTSKPKYDYEKRHKRWN